MTLERKFPLQTSTLTGIKLGVKPIAWPAVVVEGVVDSWVGWGKSPLNDLDNQYLGLRTSRLNYR